MPFRQGHHHFLVEQGLDQQAGGLAQQGPHQGHIDRTVAHGFRQLRRGVLLQRQRHLGITLPELADQPRHEGMERRRIDHADADASQVAARDALRVLGGQPHPLQDLTRIEQKGAAGAGQRHAARQALEQAGTHLLFQLTNLLAQRRLLDAQTLGRAGEVELLRNSDEIA